MNRVTKEANQLSRSHPRIQVPLQKLRAREDSFACHNIWVQLLQRSFELFTWLQTIERGRERERVYCFYRFFLCTWRFYV